MRKLMKIVENIRFCNKLRFEVALPPAEYYNRSLTLRASSEDGSGPAVAPLPRRTSLMMSGLGTFATPDSLVTLVAMRTVLIRVKAEAMDPVR